MLLNRDKFNFFATAEMRDEHWHELLALRTPKTVKAGTMLYEQSMIVHELTCISEGSVKIVHFFDNGNEKLYESLSAPTVLGMEALWCSGDSLYASVIALTDVTYTTIPIEIAQKLISKTPEMIIALFQCIRDSMCISRIRNVCSMPMTMLQKAAFALVFMQEADKDDEGYVAVTHEELAQLIGISRANITTALAELAEEGLVSKKRGKVKILDYNKLMELLDNPF
ncbi:MAG: Crp/Fnr family transcriptional regulator [Oscillospiraceae bacterium]|nr:Crp/Fnr family transcriptional regulator [Oscillospiraceae bacterium]